MFRLPPGPGGACLVIAVLAPLWSPPTPAAARPNPRLPDLAPLPSALHDRRIAEENGRLLLRFSTVIANVGSAPLEVRGRRVEGRMIGYQLVPGPRGRREVPIGEIEFHGEHGHWHLLQVAEYRLKRADGATLATASKVSFCLRDDFRAMPGLRRSPRTARFPNCTMNRAAMRLRMGLSIGWADHYIKDLEDQSLDISGLPGGEYVLEVEVNPDRILREASHRNNVVSISVTLPQWCAGPGGRSAATAACGPERGPCPPGPAPPREAPGRAAAAAAASPPAPRHRR